MTHEPDKTAYPGRVALSIPNGEILVGSDAHFWPGPRSTAWRAFVKFAKERAPRAIIFNGDALDASTISRHAPIGWEKRPSLAEELEVCQERMHELVMAMPRSTKRVWTLGNHDARFETRLASVAPEFKGVAGVHLKDQFPDWPPAWSVWVNGNTVIKHRCKGGVNAAQLNAISSGMSMVTGHLHAARVSAYTDYLGTRYGVDAGMLGDPWHRAFTDYTEDGPKNWRSGFSVLTYKNNRLLCPELVLVWDDNHVEWRGNIIKT